MKQFATIVLLVCAAHAFAQKTAGVPVNPALVSIQTEKAIPDTLFHDFFNLSPVLYTAPVGGYMSGTNGYGDVEKGQETKVDEPYLLTGIIYWFALKQKNTGGDTSSVIFNLYHKDEAQLVNGVGVYVPGTVLASDTVALDSIQAGNTFAAGLNYFALPQAIVNYQHYVATFSMELMDARDTIALYNSTDSLVDITNYSWEKWNGKWNTIKNAWVLDVDFAIFPVRDLTGASIDEQTESNLRIFPNPTTDYVQVENNLGYESYVVMNASGQVIQQGSLNTGTASRIEMAYPSGYYLLGFYSEGSKNANFYRVLVTGN